MNRSTRLITTTIATAALLALALLVAPGAGARPAPDGGPLDVVQPTSAPPVSSISYGSPLWTFALVIIATAALTIAASRLARVISRADSDQLVRS